MATAKSTELQKVEENAVTVVTPIDFSADIGAGMEGAGQEAFAIPFLTVLQKGSPQVDEDSSQHIEGAKAGMIHETVSGKLYDGKAGVFLIPCAYKRVFLRWGARDAGGGFKGELTSDAVAAMRSQGLIAEMEGRLYAPSDDGSVSDKKSDRFADTRNHFCLLYDAATGMAKQVLLSITSTQIKKSKALMSMLEAVRVPNKDGSMGRPPTYLNIVHMTTIPEQNEKGTWYGVRFELKGFLKDASVYEAAKAFNASVARGTVAARYEEEHTAQPHSDADERF